jgi:hypothetical protein
VEARPDITFNYLRYELSDGAHLVVSTVAKGTYADGNSAEDAIVEFRLAVKTRISGGLSELYFGRSEFLCQEKMFLGLEKEWEADDVKLILRNRISVPIFTLIEKVSIAVASLVVKHLAIVILHYMYFSFSSNSDKNLRLVAENPMSKKRVSKKEYKSNTE